MLKSFAVQVKPCGTIAKIGLLKRLADFKNRKYDKTVQEVLWFMR
jgi:hypothetical protein